MQDWLIYGATGYTGRLIAEQAVRSGLRPILAGRGESVRDLARDLGLEARIFPLDDPTALKTGLAGTALVLHCAGPFSATALPMMKACLEAGAHYLDITGEIGVFELAHDLDEAARAKKIVICPGVGFDVVPTDCLAAALKEALPDAVSLSLGFDSRSPLSPGTTKTMVEGLGKGGMIRRGGKLIAVPLAYDIRRIDFGAGPKTAVTIPWGDVSTAYRSTGIPDISCYITISPKAARGLRRMNWLRPILGLGFVQSFLKRRIERTVKGPDEAQRAQLATLVWGEVRNERGEVRVGRVQTPNGYSLTVDSALALAKRVLDQPPAGGGFKTPSMLAGWHLLEELPGAGRIVIGPA